MASLRLLSLAALGIMVMPSVRAFAGMPSVRAALRPAQPAFVSQLSLPLRAASASTRQICASRSGVMGRFALPVMPVAAARRALTTRPRMSGTAAPDKEGEVSIAGGYPFKDLEQKWQSYWKENDTFRTPEKVDMSKPKFYVLDMFPYPSGAGLHVGHPEGYTATDIMARYKRMNGFNVMHPMGWDAFGLPAEQYAIQTGTHPAVTTEKNINRFREQLQALGFSYDWKREVSTTDENYYKWTQWIFLQLLEKDLAYQAEVPVNWCPALGTVLANEEVINGLSERGDHPVFRKNLKQWMLKITAYADRLIDDLDDLDWPDSVKEMQRNWIGKSQGAEVAFKIKRDAGAAAAAPAQEVEDGKVFVGGLPWAMTWQDLKEEMETLGEVTTAKVVLDRETGRSKGFGFVEFKDKAAADKAIAASGSMQLGGRTVTINAAKRSERYAAQPAAKAPAAAAADEIRVFTTRPDTLFGATYMVLSPENPLLESVTTAEHAAAVKEYVVRASTKSDLERTELQKDKTGLFTGSYAINPLTGEEVPIWVADYVLNTYGTGAIMAVPAHDERDHEFAKKFGLPIKEVVSGGEDVQQAAFTGSGPLVNSGNAELDLNGLLVDEAKAKTITFLQATGQGEGKINYKLRDWLFSRQRYWGEPFPVSFLDDGTLVPATLDQLPVTLPKTDKFEPSGTTEGPLSTIEDWVYHDTPQGRARRETNTMPQWAGSCWYYLRFLDPENPGKPIDPEIEKYWMPVDMYVGGAEHAVLHLLYARFWHKVLYDCGIVHTKEPFQRLVNQGLILGPVEHTAYYVADSAVSAKDVQPWTTKDVNGNGIGGPVLKKDKSPVEARKILDADVVKKGDKFVLKSDDKVQVTSKAVKMSKSRGNVVNPDDIIAGTGADALRLYLMFMGPLEQVKPWNTKGVDGVYRFLSRAWRLIAEGVVPATTEAASKEQLKVLHKTIKKVTSDTDKMSFNTAIAAMMEFVNDAYKWDTMPHEVSTVFVQLLNPYAPHVAEELWERLGNGPSISESTWPEFDEQYLIEDSVTVAVQVNGKVRATISVAPDADQATVMSIAQADPSVLKWIEGKEIKKKIYVPGKICNIVVDA